MNSEQIKLTIGKWLIPAILITVALQQIRLATTKNLSPWRGGGFGMFSTIDQKSTRYIKLYGIKKGKKSALYPPPGGSRVRDYPKPRALEKYLNQLQYYEWTEILHEHGNNYLYPFIKDEFRITDREFNSYTYFCIEIWSFAPNKEETKYTNKKIISRCKNPEDLYNVMDLYKNENNKS